MMEKYLIKGGKSLQGEVEVSGAKNAVLKAMVAACLTKEKVVIKNVPLISDMYIMAEIIRELGGTALLEDHMLTVQMEKFSSHRIPLDRAAEVRTSSMFIAPLLARVGQAIIPNPGGCRLGARPIDRTIDGIRRLGVSITYHSEDGYFHAQTKKLQAISYTFEKNTHTGTETMLLAAVLAQGKTTLHNAAEEPEVDELIDLLKSMGAKVDRIEPRTIVVEGVPELHGGSMTVQPDRNEIVTLACAAILTKGDVFVKEAKEEPIKDFLDTLRIAGGGVEVRGDGIRFFYKKPLLATNVTTLPHPGFMTDWQGPWAVLMTSAEGDSVIHETVFENRFGYVKELRKMGAKITLFNPVVTDKKTVYNFNLADDSTDFFHAAKVSGPTALHDGVVTMSDIRSGATLVLAALAAKGESTILGIEKLDRGYEQLEKRLTKLGASIRRVQI